MFTKPCLPLIVAALLAAPSLRAEPSKFAATPSFGYGGNIESRPSKGGLALGFNGYFRFSDWFGMPLFLSIAAEGDGGAGYMSGVHIGQIVFGQVLVGYVRHSASHSASIGVGGAVGVEIPLGRYFGITMQGVLLKAFNEDGFAVMGLAGPSLRYVPSN